MSESQKVIFIEPIEKMQQIYRAVIKPEENGWDLQFVSTGPQALALNAQAPVDILIAPEKMPGSGTSFLGEVKKATPETIRFLLVSKPEEDCHQATVGPAQQVLIAPIKPSSFTEQVNKALTLRTLINNPEIFTLTGDGDTLPPLPRIFDQLSVKLSNLDTGMGEIADIIAQDVVLSAKVLRTVNSALFSLRSNVENLAQAVSMLGTSTIRSIVFAQGVCDAFKTSAMDELFFENLNRHSIICSKVVEKLLFNWGNCRRMIDQGVFCSFAHDLGKIILGRYAKDKWDEVLRRVRAGEGADIDLERSIIGVGHAEIAAYLLAVWGFSNDQVFAVAFHHDPALSHQTERGILCALHIAEHSLPVDFQHGTVDLIWLEKCGFSGEDLVQCQEMAEEIALRDAIDR